MRKFAFVIFLLIPLISFGQAEKRYRSIIVDSLKALNGGRIDVKDTLLLDSLAQYNTDLSLQYTSRSLVDSAFVGTAISASGGNTIYSADDNLTGDRIVTMGANSLTFSGNLTTFKGIDATSSNFVVKFQDNVGTDLLSIRDDGFVTTNNDAGATFGTRSAGVIAAFSFTAGKTNNTTNVSASASSFALGIDNIVPGLFAGALNSTNISSGRSSLVINEGNTVSGDQSFGGGTSTTVSGNIALGWGDNVTVTQLRGLGLGTDINNTHALAHVIGAGANSTTGRLASTNVTSLTIAYNSDVATLFVGSASGVGTFGNVGIAGITSFGTNAQGSIGIGNGFAPGSSPANMFQMYADDIVAGNSAPHFRTENGDIIKLFADGSYVDPTGTSDKGTFATSTVTIEDLAEFVKAMYESLKANGFLKN